MPIDAGDMDREITIQTGTRSTDTTTGQEILTWATTATIWAELMSQSAREVWQARQIDATIERVYRSYYRDDVFPDVSRLIDLKDGRTYDIKGVEEIGREEGLLISVAARAEAAA